MQTKWIILLIGVTLTHKMYLLFRVIQSSDKLTSPSSSPYNKLHTIDQGYDINSQEVIIMQIPNRKHFSFAKKLIY